MNLTQYIFENSRNLDNKIAIFQGDKKYSFSELYSLILKISRKLDDLPLNSDEKIVIVSDNSLFFIASYFGIIASGRVAVPLHNQFGEDNLKYVIDSCKVSCFFLQRKYIKKFDKYGISTKFLFSDDNFEGAINVFDLKNEEGAIVPVNEKLKLAVIIFTSGSTGMPKGVMQSSFKI